MYTALGAKGNQIILVEKCWSRTDKANVALVHAKRLGELVYTAPARERVDSR